MLDGNVCQEAAGGMAGGAIGVEFMSSVALGWVLGVGRHLFPASVIRSLAFARFAGKGLLRERL